MRNRGDRGLWEWKDLAMYLVRQASSISNLMGNINAQVGTTYLNTLSSSSLEQ
jgi:hypothetical protein